MQAWSGAAAASATGGSQPHLMMSSRCRSCVSAVQSFFRTFTQISPALETLGWKILVVKKPADEGQRP